MFGLPNKYERMAKKGNVAALGKYASEPHPLVRMRVVKALEQVTNNMDAGTALVVYLWDPDREVQLEAVKAMGMVGIASAANHLVRVITEAKEKGDDELANAASDALDVLHSRVSTH